MKKYTPERKPKTHNVILKASSEIKMCLLNMERMVFDWVSYPVYEYCGTISVRNMGIKQFIVNKKVHVCQLVNIIVDLYVKIYTKIEYRIPGGLYSLL